MMFLLQKQSKIIATGILAVLTFTLLVVHLVNTSPFEQTWDVEGHIDHIVRVKTFGTIPMSKDCWQCYQPPLYYGIAAAWLSLFETVSPFDSERMLQILAFVLMLSCLAVCFFIVRTSARSVPYLFITSLAIIWLWPSGIIHSSRIGNDNLFYVFHGLTILTLISTSTQKRNQFILASVFSCAALLSKANGFVTIALLFSVISYRWWGHRSEVSFRKMYLIPFIICTAGITLFLLIVVRKGALYSNADLLGPLYHVGNSVKSFAGFSFTEYFNPFLSTSLNGNGKQYVWIFLLKSSLFGEFASSNSAALTIVPATYFLLLIVIAISLIGLVKNWKHPDRIVHAFNIILLVTALLLYRAKFPYSCSGDFRYIYPVVVSMGLFFCDGIKLFFDKKHRLIGLIGLGCMTLLLILGAGIVLTF